MSKPLSAPVRIGLYIRVSTDMQATHGVSIAAQEARLRENVGRHPSWHIVDVYIDDGYSGHDMDRPEVRRCMEDAASGKLDKVLALDIDRAHRNEQNRRNFEQHLLDHGVDMLYDLEPQFDRVSLKNLSRGMRGVIAEYYSDWASETTRDKMIYMAKQGKRTGGPIPFGLRVDEEGQYERDPEWFPILEQIFGRRSNGESVRQIARWLSSEEIPAPGLLEWMRKPIDARGRPKRRPSGKWTRYTVERILRNEAYHGTLVYNRSFGKRHDFAPKDEDERIRVDDAWEKFIDDDTWYRVKVLDSETSTQRESTRARSQFLLANVTCLRCGHSMHGYTANKQKDLRNGERRTYYYRKYRCTGRANSASCDAPMIRAQHLEDLVIDAIGEYLVQNADATEELYNRSKEMLESYKQSLAQLIENSDVDVEDKTRERSAMVRALATAIGRVSDTTIQEMDSEIAKLADDIAKSRARGQLAKDELNKLSGARLRLDSLRDNLSELGHQLERADLPTKKRLLSGLVSGIEVDPDKHHAIVHIRHFVFDHGIDLRLADDEFS
jgi:site-specific DNA recombinase